MLKQGAKRGMSSSLCNIVTEPKDLDSEPRSTPPITRSGDDTGTTFRL